MPNLQALKLALETEASPLQKEILWRRAKKIIKRQDYSQLSPLILYRWCCARFRLQDFSDFTGWEWRDDRGWSADMLFRKQPLPRWDGGYVERLWVVGEQGIGDEVFWASLLPEALTRVKEVVYECDQRIHPILKRSFPKLVCVHRDGTDHWNERSGVFIPAGDLLRLFRRDVKHFPGKPYLRPDRDRAEALRQYRGRVGVAYRGRQGSIDPFKFELLNPLDLQYGEEEVFERPFDVTNDLDSLLSLLSVLEKVVTVPQSLWHFAGSVGCKAEVVLPEIPGEVVNEIPWEYFPGKLPWYPDVTVFNSITEWKTHVQSDRQIRQ